MAAAGTLRALVRDLDGSRDLATIVDVGATRTTVITREGLHLRSVRTLPTGGLDLTKALMSATKESLAAAEKRKYQLRLPVVSVDVNTPMETYGGLDPDADEDYLRALADQTSAEQALGAAVDSLVDQIAQAIETDNENLGRFTHHLALCA
jgi:Tfp pilus assembly PilM family ATPase